MQKPIKAAIKYISVILAILIVAFNFDIVSSFLQNIAVASAVMNVAPSQMIDVFLGENETNKNEASSKKGITKKEENSSKTQKEKVESTTEKTVTVATKGKVLGKITEKDLSNSGANTSFQNIYFNNATGTNININQLLNSNINFRVEKNAGPQVLIYHTHATECYMDKKADYYTDKDKTRTTDKSKNMVAVGEVLANEIEKSGFSVVHDKTLHDYPSYSGSYNNSANTINKTLKKYPSIKIIIDLHRDSIGTKTEKTATTKLINGKSAAQVMLVMGSNTGFIDNHPNWKENLKLATRLQQTFNNKYPGLSRALLLRSSLYNQNLSKGAMLIEIGTEANTLSEAKYSATLVGKSIVSVMKGIEK